MQIIIKVQRQTPCTSAMMLATRGCLKMATMFAPNVAKASTNVTRRVTLIPGL